MPNRSGCLLSLRGLTPTGTRAEHLDNGIGSKGGKAVRNGTDGEFFDSLPDFLNPKFIFLYRDTDIGILAEHLVDGDQVLIVLIVTVRCEESVL